MENPFLLDAYVIQRTHIFQVNFFYDRRFTLCVDPSVLGQSILCRSVTNYIGEFWSTNWKRLEWIRGKNSGNFFYSIKLSDPNNIDIYFLRGAWITPEAHYSHHVALILIVWCEMSQGFDY